MRGRWHRLAVAVDVRLEGAFFHLLVQGSLACLLHAVLVLLVLLVQVLIAVCTYLSTSQFLIVDLYAAGVHFRLESEVGVLVVLWCLPHHFWLQQALNRIFR